MISMKCLITDIDNNTHYSIEDLIEGDLSELEAACMDFCNHQGDFFSMKVEGGVFTIPKSRIKDVRYVLEEVEEEDE